MTMKLVVAAVFSWFALAGAPAPPATMACQGGSYFENDKPLPAGNYDCKRQPGANATAIAINVEASAYASGDNPPCATTDTDGPTREFAKAALLEGLTAPTFPQLWERVLRRANTWSSDAMGLATGDAKGGSRCQVFVVRVPHTASKIKVVEFRAHQNSSKDDPVCFTAKPVSSVSSSMQAQQSSAVQGRGRAAPNAPPATTTEIRLTQISGGCSIGWSAWQSAKMIEGSGATVVAAVFKNWSYNTMRTGQLWVWY